MKFFNQGFLLIGLSFIFYSCSLKKEPNMAMTGPSLQSVMEEVLFNDNHRCRTIESSGFTIYS